MNLTKLSNYACRRFTEHYGRPAAWLVAAPGRVNVIGEHTDYNEGFVLPMAIERYTVIAAAPALESRVRLVSGSVKEGAEFSCLKTVERGMPVWSNYVRGVMAGFQNRGMEAAGFDGLIESTIPLGGGLSSSAALEVATATLLAEMTGAVLDPIEKALICRRAEHDFAGVPCGIMDQYVTTLGRERHLLLIDCRSRECEYIGMSDPAISVLVANSNVKHDLAESAYARRRAQCDEAARLLSVASLRDATIETLESRKRDLDPVGFRRARHIITENERTVRAADAIRTGDWREAGRLMYESHDSLRDLYEVSCNELDVLVDLAREIGEAGGVFGSRMTGGGFGGCTVSLVRTGRVGMIADVIRDQYRSKTGIEPAVFSTRPAGGARVLCPIDSVKERAGTTTGISD